MVIRFYLKKFNRMVEYDKVNLVCTGSHKFPSGKNRKCLTFVLDNGDTINYAFSEVADLCIEDYFDQRHPFNDDSKVIFVEGDETYVKR